MNPPHGLRIEGNYYYECWCGESFKTRQEFLDHAIDIFKKAAKEESKPVEA